MSQPTKIEVYHNGICINGGFIGFDNVQVSTDYHSPNDSLKDHYIYSWQSMTPIRYSPGIGSVSKLHLSFSDAQLIQIDDIYLPPPKEMVRW